MPHHTPLIATIAAGLTVAFIFGVIAHRLRVSPLVGYLLAGVVVGPFTPGYVADQELATELAEIGVILLMFGVGLHFSLKDLMAVRKIAIPGAVAQMAAATVMGMGLAHLLGWSPVSGFVFGLALSVASTVVLLRALQERRIVQTERGHIAVGWLIVEDLAMVLALVLLPALAGAITQSGDGGGGGSGGMSSWLIPLGTTFAKVAGFVAFMLIVGRRVVPWVLHYVAHTGSRELFRLAVLTIALGVAFGAAALFGVSFALGAFFAGMILAESELSQRAAEETLPLRDAFAVLFFVSVGMLFNPMVILQQPWPLLATLGIIVVGKSVAALVIMRAFRRNSETSLTVAASLAQIGEFSFILAGLGVSLGLLPPEGRDLVLAGAILSIMLNPLVFAVFARAARRTGAQQAAVGPGADLAGHTVVIGFGRVGAAVAAGLKRAGAPLLVVEDRDEGAEAAADAGYAAVAGNAADPRVLAQANLAAARRIIVAIPDTFEAGQIVEQARRANPAIEVVARAHSDEEAAHLTQRGANVALMDEAEVAKGIISLAAAPPAEPPHAGPLALPSTAEGPERGANPILSDAEHAVLSAFRQIGAGPKEAVSHAALAAHTEHSGHGPDQVRGACAALAEKGCVTDLGDGRVALTLRGFETLTLKQS